jgi:hypothetical protein
MFDTINFMIPWRHKWQRLAFKCILSAIWLALFVAQLSSKFYRFSSFPPTYKVAASRFKPCGNQALSLYNHPGKVFLCLDKRYDIKPVFTLANPSFRIDHPQIQYKQGFYTHAAGIISNDRLSTSLRGPPVSA